MPSRVQPGPWGSLCSVLGRAAVCRPLRLLETVLPVAAPGVDLVAIRAGRVALRGIGLGPWWLARCLPGPDVLWFVVLGGVKGIGKHLFRNYELCILEKRPGYRDWTRCEHWSFRSLSTCCTGRW